MLAITVTALDVAAISALAAVVAPATAWLSAIGGRRHERDTARESRLYADVRDAYADLLTKLHEYEGVILRSRPRAPDPGIEPPPALADLMKKPEWDAELIRAAARVAVVGSEEVAKVVEELDQSFDTFWETLGKFEKLAQGDPSSVDAASAAFSRRVRELEEADAERRPPLARKGQGSRAKSWCLGLEQELLYPRPARPPRPPAAATGL